MAGEDPRPESVPPWAQFFSLGDYRRFLNLVGQELRGRGIEFQRRDYLVIFTLPNGRPYQLPLDNLARGCHQASKPLWSQWVENEIDRLLSEALEEPETAPESPSPEPSFGEDQAPPGGIRSPFASGRMMDHPQEIAAAAIHPNETQRTKAPPESVAPTWVPPGPQPPGRPKMTPTVPAMQAPTPIATNTTTPPGPPMAPPPVVPRKQPAPPLQAPALPEAAEAQAPVESISSYSKEEAEDDSQLFGSPTFRKYLPYGLAAILLYTLTMEVVAYFSEVKDTTHVATYANEVLLEADPAGLVLAISEKDGMTLGRPPLRFLMPRNTEANLLLAAPGFIPQRVNLPLKGSVKVKLKPMPKKPERCSITPPKEDKRTFQAVGYRAKITEEKIVVEGAAIIRAFPEGLGAWLIVCPSLGGTGQVNLDYAVPTHHDVYVTMPEAALAHAGERPIGRVPTGFSTQSSFAQIHLKTVQGHYLTRWVPIPDNIEIQLPSDDTQTPPITIPGTKEPNRVPTYLRPSKEELKLNPKLLQTPY